MFNITIKSRRVDNTNDNFEGSDAWRVTLRWYSRTLTTNFYKGPGHKGAPPEVGEVLSCLISDAESVENAESFESWCADLSYDSDSRKAEKIYKACKATSVKLRAFLGESYDKVAESVRDL